MQKETKYIAIRIPLKKCFVKNEKKNKQNNQQK